MDKFVTRNFGRDSFNPDAFIAEACEKIPPANRIVCALDTPKPPAAIEWK